MVDDGGLLKLMGICVYWAMCVPLVLLRLTPQHFPLHFCHMCSLIWHKINKCCMFLRTFLKQEIVDDYTFECEVGGQAQKTKVSIFQSMGDPLVYGKIYCAKEQKAEEENTDLKLIHPP